MGGWWPILALIWSTTASAEVPAPIVASILIRALEYDRAIPHGSSPLHVVLIGEPGPDGSLSPRCTALANALSKMRLSEHPVRTTVASVDDIGAHTLARAWFACTSLGPRRDGIGMMARAHGILLVSEDRADVEGPFALGIIDDGRPRIVVNVQAARNQGTDLSAALFRVAELVAAH